MAINASEWERIYKVAWGGGLGPYLLLLLLLLVSTAGIG